MWSIFRNSQHTLFNYRTPAVRGKKGINEDSTGNYNQMDEESTGGMVIPPGITSSWTRNVLEELLFRGDLRAQERRTT
jgi:hypothetical protein